MTDKDPKTDSAASVPPPPASPQAPAGAERPKEYGGRAGPEPTRYGDWEKNGICSDF